jgi:hypothetical protein
MSHDSPEANGHAGAKKIPSEMLRIGRDLPRTIRREMDERPAIVLATVAGTSFVAGAVLGSRIGRVLLATLIPIGAQYLMRTRLGPSMWQRIVEMIEDATNGGAEAGRQSSQ